MQAPAISRALDGCASRCSVQIAWAAASAALILPMLPNCPATDPLRRSASISLAPMARRAPARRTPETLPPRRRIRLDGSSDRRERGIVEHRKRLRYGRVVAFRDMPRDPPADRGALAVTVSVRDAQCRGNLCNRAAFDALQRHDGVLPGRALVVPFAKVGIATALGRAAHVFVNPRQRFRVARFARSSVTACEITPHERILAKRVRLVKVAKKMLCGCCERRSRVFNACYLVQTDALRHAARPWAMEKARTRVR